MSLGVTIVALLSAAWNVVDGTPLQPLLCGSLSTSVCVNTDFAMLTDTRNSAARVDTSSLRQTDDESATLADPGAWRLTRSNSRLDEDSGIRGSSLVACPLLGAVALQPVGTYLRFLRIATSITGTEREIRSVVRANGDASAWVGVAFGYRNNGDDVLRVVARPGDRCFVLQRRVAAAGFQTLAATTPSAAFVVDAQFEVRIRYGGGFVFVRLLTWPGLQQIASMTSAAVNQTATEIGGDYAIFSSDADTASGNVFESYSVFNTAVAINEPEPVTEPPTPAPTPAPTPIPATPAPTPFRVDCVVSEWSAWSACSQTARCMVEPGRQTRQRNVIVMNQAGGAACPLLSESQACNVDVPCPTTTCNCVGCSVGSAVGSATWCRCCQFAMNPMCTAASCTTNNIYMKSGCITSGWCQVINSTATRFCGFDKYPTEDYCGLPIPCGVSEWSSWSTCSLSCEAIGGTIGPGLTPNGNFSRTRTVTRFPKNGGAACPTLTETATCNTTPCPQNCVVGEWSAFSTCSATCPAVGATEPYVTTGSQTRTRAIVTSPTAGGAACSSLREDQNCNRTCIPDVNCELTPFGQWSACSTTTADAACVPPNEPRTCGNGQVSRSRFVVRPALGNGTPCPTVLSETDACVTQCSVNCTEGLWSAWSGCSVPCGGGTERRARTIEVQPQFCGRGCLSTTEQRSCNAQACVVGTPPVDCVLSAYVVAPTERCSVPACGGGVLTARATIVTPTQGAGKPCPSLTQSQPCNTMACPAIITNTPGLRWRMVSSDSIDTFVWASFRTKLAYYVAVDENRFSLRSVLSGSTIVEFHLADAVDDPAVNYQARLASATGNAASGLNVITSGEIVPSTTTTAVTAAATTTTVGPSVATTTTATTSAPVSTTTGVATTTTAPATTQASTTTAATTTTATTTTAAATTTTAATSTTVEATTTGLATSEVETVTSRTETILSMPDTAEQPALTQELIIIIAVVASVVGILLIVSIILGAIFVSKRNEKKSAPSSASLAATPMYDVKKAVVDEKSDDDDVFVAEQLFDSDDESGSRKTRSRSRSGHREERSSSRERRPSSTARSSSSRRERSSSRTRR
jgi:hypothetical protein